MANLFEVFSKKRKNGLKLMKSESGESWVVKKGYSILYIGTKEKCQVFLNQGQLA